MNNLPFDSNASTKLHYCVRELPYVEDLAGRVAALSGEMPLVWLDSAREHALIGRYSIAAWKPWLCLEAFGSQIRLETRAGRHVWSGDPLIATQSVLDRFALRETAAPLSQALALFGAFGYGLNHWVEPRVAYRAQAGVPDLLLWGMQCVWVQDHVSRKTWAVGVGDPFGEAPEQTANRNAEAAVELYAQALPCASENPPQASAPMRLIADAAQTDFEAWVRQAQCLIGEGEIFQANLAQRFRVAQAVDPWTLYSALRRINPSPFACLIRNKDVSIVSCSPERLVSVQQDTVSARPIAGTRPRGANADEDTLQSLDLMMNEKERAEHIMLVDLARNDLGRICVPGSMRVDELLGLETYSHVIHIVSNVTGRLIPDAPRMDVLRAVFPGGTITGCPKVRCMQILDALEPTARGFYTGSAGYLGLNGDLDLNILIRTLTVRPQELTFHVGAGIVADSDPSREYDETLAKARALMEALQQVGMRDAATH